ncbi:hypothetical protein, conserved in T. vivax [Trypanosoma vivax Y486]|uniref:Uncharacterized protein n=1 Tax=Trypanosoma vivax (strain Y486) TaxID=1055687 RepID=F9WV82_TRYVY|nr:hypothetical protein, conserved in T. vivax [Trypanosoma vivax Y486]|eukprot:CCD21488.1 hypothetical protein, conserved in T. vivax [Trypanosoma vivax Y486]
MARPSLFATTSSAASLAASSSGCVTGSNASQIVCTIRQFVASASALAPLVGFSSVHLSPAPGPDFSAMPTAVKLPSGAHGALFSVSLNHRVPAWPLPPLLHSQIMSEARHVPACPPPHPVFSEVLPPIVVLNSSPVAFAPSSVSAPASTASADSFFTSAAPFAASVDQRHASHSGRAPVAHSCAAFVVFTSITDPRDTCSFLACQSASLHRATLPAAPVAASTASSATRLARHSSKKSAAACPFVAPSPSPTRVQRAAQSSHAATRSWQGMLPIYLLPLPCAAPPFAPRCTSLAANPCVHAPRPCLFSTT